MILRDAIYFRAYYTTNPVKRITHKFKNKSRAVEKMLRSFQFPFLESLNYGILFAEISFLDAFCMEAQLTIDWYFYDISSR